MPKVKRPLLIELRSCDLSVKNYVPASIYTNFTTTIVDDSHFGTDGKFVTGLPWEDLVLAFDPLGPFDAKKTKPYEVCKF